MGKTSKSLSLFLRAYKAVIRKACHVLNIVLSKFGTLKENYFSGELFSTMVFESQENQNLDVVLYANTKKKDWPFFIFLVVRQLRPKLPKNPEKS